MSDLEDLFSTLEEGGDEKPFGGAQKENNNSYGGGNNNNYGGGNNYQQRPKKKNYWDDEQIVPKKVDVSTFSRTGKRFAIAIDNRVTVPEAAKENILKIAKGLIAKGYSFRHGSDENDTLANAILSLEGCKSESFLPWKKFNPKIEKPTLSPTNGGAYGIAANSHKVFAKLKPPIRAILAKDVLVMLGAECKEPLDMLITYTECGSEAIVKNMDFKKTGSVTFFLKVAGDSNIPVFNVKKDDALRRIGELVKANEN